MRYKRREIKGMEYIADIILFICGSLFFTLNRFTPYILQLEKL
jgi:hypothetical protein